MSFYVQRWKALLRANTLHFLQLFPEDVNGWHVYNPLEEFRRQRILEPETGDQSEIHKNVRGQWCALMQNFLFLFNAVRMPSWKALIAYFKNDDGCHFVVLAQEVCTAERVGIQTTGTNSNLKFATRGWHAFTGFRCFLILLCRDGACSVRCSKIKSVMRQ